MSLDCWYCGCEFPDFALLAEHVKKVHGTTNAFEWKKGGTRPPLGRAAKENYSMPRNTKQQWPDANGDNQDYNPWLTVENLGRSGKATLTILGNPRASTSQFGDGVIVDVKIGNSEYSWTVKFSSGNYGRLVKKMGKPDKWRGKVNVEVKEYMGKEYVAVV